MILDDSTLFILLITFLDISILFIHCITCCRSAFSSLFVICGSIAGVPTSPSFSLHYRSITNYGCIYTWGWPYPFHGGWSQLCFPSRECPRCATHIAIMPLEPLIADSSAPSTTLVFEHFRGDVPYTNKPFQDC